MQIAERCKGRVDLAFGAGFQDAKRHPVRARRMLDVPDHGVRIAIVWVYKQGKRPSLRNQLGKQFQSLENELNGNILMPVRLPPGRARLGTSPSWTGSLPIVKTVGMVEVAFFAALAQGGPKAAIKSGLRLTRSAANKGSRS